MGQAGYSGLGRAVTRFVLAVRAQPVGRAWDRRGRFCFFQAEDGIRDLTVTGVQTCALPIWRSLAGSAPSDPVQKVTPFTGLSTSATSRSRAAAFVMIRGNPKIGHGGSSGWIARSEERRGGEEGRSRWSPDH